MIPRLNRPGAVAGCAESRLFLGGTEYLRTTSRFA
jgi:hypothetical protein